MPRRRWPRVGAIAAAALVVSSCHMFGSFETGPEGRSRYDTELRRLARSEDFDAAVELTEPEVGDESGDELLRLLHRGLLLHYAGRYRESNEALQLAETMIEDRYTKSVSRAALSLVTSDRSLRWLPNSTERLMVNYYGALNYLALGELDEAAVEARRLSRWLELGEDDPVSPAEAAFRRGMRYVAGSVFETAGDRNNAAVAYRHVWSPEERVASTDPLWPRFLDLWGGLETRSDMEAPGVARADSTPSDLVGPLPSPPEQQVVEPPQREVVGPPQAQGDGGDVVVLIERGFVAHRVERAVNIPLFPEEAETLGDDDEAVRLAAAECVALRGFGESSEFSDLFGGDDTSWRRDGEGRCVVRGSHRSRRLEGDESDDSPERDFYLMRVAWPEMVRSGLPGDLPVRALSVQLPAGATVLASIERSTPAGNAPDAAALPDTAGRAADLAARARLAPAMDVSLSESVIGEFDAQLGGILLKAVARAATKYAVARGIESAVSEEDETLGDIAGLAANAVGAALERADTRCWHLLPDEVSVLRLRLPPGRFPLTLRVDTGRSRPLLVDLGAVEVRDGSVHVLAARVWP